MKMAQKCKFFRTAGGKTEQEIKKSEQLLGIEFSKQCREFYEEYGYLSFYGTEIFGIDPDDIDDILEGNSVAYALNDRKEYGLPKAWIPLYDMGDGSLAYFDYDNLNDDGEPRIIVAVFNGNGYEIEEILAEDFGNFLLERVEEQLNKKRIKIFR